ncbi:MAG: M15 family metallopeptidase, partial [Candidatus Gracilibacteria bacterium]
PPELDDSKREVPMMGSKKALEYYEKLVGHEKKSFGWIMKIEVFGVEVTVNIVMACLLKELEARCKAMGMAEDFKFKNLSGYVVKGGFHDYGMAIDFDAPDNWLAKPEKTKWNLPMAMVIELQKMGFKWGMYFDKGRSDGMTDAMHFEYRGTIEDAIGQLKSPEAIQLAESCVLPKRFGEKTLYQYALRDKESLSRV